MAKVSIVIRCYNEAQHIGRLLDGILHQSLQNLEIIVVDSGSTDGTVEIASHYPIKLLSIRPQDFSFGYALNVGCEAATGEFIVLASAHVFPIYQDWLENLLAPFSNSKIALTYGKQRGLDTSQYSERQIFSTWFPDTSDIQIQDNPFCNNANAAIRRSLWVNHSYDESLTGLEDLAWAKHILTQGYHVAYVPQAEIIHVHNETPLRTYNRYRREAIALKHIYPQENFTLWDFARLCISNITSDYAHALRDNVLSNQWRAIPTFRLMQFWGTYCGYQQRAPVSKQLRQTFYYPRSLSKSPSTSPNTTRQVINYASRPQSLEQVH